MTDRQFTPVFVAATILLSWVWRLAQDHHVPWFISATGGALCILLLHRWLDRRLAAAGKVGSGEAAR